MNEDNLRAIQHIWMKLGHNNFPERASWKTKMAVHKLLQRLSEWTAAQVLEDQIIGGDRRLSAANSPIVVAAMCIRAMPPLRTMNQGKFDHLMEQIGLAYSDPGKVLNYDAE